MMKQTKKTVIQLAEIRARQPSVKKALSSDIEKSHVGLVVQRDGGEDVCFFNVTSKPMFSVGDGARTLAFDNIPGVGCIKYATCPIIMKKNEFKTCYETNINSSEILKNNPLFKEGPELGLTDLFKTLCSSFNNGKFIYLQRSSFMVPTMTGYSSGADYVYVGEPDILIPTECTPLVTSDASDDIFGNWKKFNEIMIQGVWYDKDGLIKNVEECFKGNKPFEIGIL